MQNIALTDAEVIAVKRITGQTRARQAVRALIARHAKPAATRMADDSDHDAKIYKKHWKKLSAEAFDAMRYQVPL